MSNRIIYRLVLFVKLFLIIETMKISVDADVNLNPIPPQPSQYTTSVILNGEKGIYYADTTISRDKLQLFNSNEYAIIDFENLRQYIIDQQSCSWSEIPGKIHPLLSFSTYQFNGNVTYDQKLAYQWSGCHNYEIPPAPYYYYATINQSIPLDLNLPTIDLNIQFYNFTYGPAPSSTFFIPQNCTKTIFNQQFNRFYPLAIKKNNNINIIC